MLSMIFVMITMALESAERIMEVLTEESTLQNPQHPVMEVKDGSIDFDHVSFKYSKKAAATPCPTSTCTSSPARSSACWAAPARRKPL